MLEVKEINDIAIDTHCDLTDKKQISLLDAALVASEQFIVAWRDCLGHTDSNDEGNKHIVRELMKRQFSRMQSEFPREIDDY
jgi:hypothetical protein